MDVIKYWNQVCLDVSRLDFTTSGPEVSPTPEQGGPTKTSRALAIVHLAMYDAYTATSGEATYLTYTTPSPIGQTTDFGQAAVCAAATETLQQLFPRSSSFILEKGAEFLMTVPSGDPEVEQGMHWGRRVAAAILAERSSDKSDLPSTYAYSQEPGRHRPDPDNPGQTPVGPRWGEVTPFTAPNLIAGLVNEDPPAMNSTRYAKAFEEVKDFGQKVSPKRQAEQTVIGIFWGYDGARNIGVPPRIYNQAVRAISEAAGATEAQNAKLFAAVNAAMADAGIRAWYEKYLHNFWRPVVGIRESDEGWGPTGKGDGNPNTGGDPRWLPLGAPTTNQSMGGMTPGFPAYPSGHATFGTVALRVAQRMLELPGEFEFEMVSEEYNGKNFDLDGVRPRYKAKFTIDEAVKDNFESRVWLGVHWRFDGTRGVTIGEQLADHIASTFPSRKDI